MRTTVHEWGVCMHMDKACTHTFSSVQNIHASLLKINAQMFQIQAHTHTRARPLGGPRHSKTGILAPHPQSRQTHTRPLGGPRRSETGVLAPHPQSSPSNTFEVHRPAGSTEGASFRTRGLCERVLLWGHFQGLKLGGTRDLHFPHVSRSCHGTRDLHFPHVSRSCHGTRDLHFPHVSRSCHGTRDLHFPHVSRSCHGTHLPLEGAGIVLRFKAPAQLTAMLVEFTGLHTHTKVQRQCRHCHCLKIVCWGHQSRTPQAPCQHIKFTWALMSCWEKSTSQRRSFATGPSAYALLNHTGRHPYRHVHACKEYFHQHIQAQATMYNLHTHTIERLLATASPKAAGVKGQTWTWTSAHNTFALRGQHLHWEGYT